MPDLRSASDASVVVVIVNYRTPALTETCLAALIDEKRRLPKLKVVVVDGGSADSSAERLAAVVAEPQYEGWVSFLALGLNGGFGWANNQAILAMAKEAQPPEFIHLLNPDAEISRGAIESLVSALLCHSRCGAAGSQLSGQDGKPSGSAFRFPSSGREFISGAQSESLARWLGIGSTVVRETEGSEVDWVTGASVMFRTDALKQTGLFDDGFFLYFEEVELMHRLRRSGWTVRYVPQSKVLHIEGASTGVDAIAGTRAMPAYWYQSRRRYFVRTAGPAAFFSANGLFLLGRVIALAKRLIGKPGPASSIRVRDLFRWGFVRRQLDAVASYPMWGDSPGKPPLWMKGT